jgi:hypothetical protein
MCSLRSGTEMHALTLADTDREFPKSAPLAAPWEGLPEAIEERLRNLPLWALAADENDLRKWASTVAQVQGALIRWYARSLPRAAHGLQLRFSHETVRAACTASGFHVVTSPRTAFRMEFLLDPAAWEDRKWTVVRKIKVSSVLFVSTSTTTVFDMTGNVSQMQKRHDVLQRMSPKKRALFERIVGLRQKIGPVGMNLAESIRELRENG